MKTTQSILTHYQATDKTAEILQKKGFEIICIAYGYSNFCDLIVFR